MMAAAHAQLWQRRTTLAATNKCLAKSNKSRTEGNATKERDSIKPRVLKRPKLVRTNHEPSRHRAGSNCASRPPAQIEHHRVQGVLHFVGNSRIPHRVAVDIQHDFERISRRRNISTSQRECSIGSAGWCSLASATCSKKFESRRASKFHDRQSCRDRRTRGVAQNLAVQIGRNQGRLPAAERRGIATSKPSTGNSSALFPADP
jgi:hypothetical protein